MNETTERQMKELSAQDALYDIEQILWQHLFGHAESFKDWMKGMDAIARIRRVLQEIA